MVRSAWFCIGLFASVAVAMSAVREDRLFAQSSTSSTGIDRFVQSEMTKRRVPGAVVAVVSNGSVTFEAAYGVSNLETETRMTTDSVFEIASVTKPITATAIMMLEEERRIDLDHPLTGYFPEAPPTWRSRTVRQVLSHTAGFALDGIVRRDGSPLLTVTAKQELADAFQQPFVFEAGENAAYSDLGYFVLGALIERVSGTTYRNFLQEHIFTPVHMTNTRVMDRLEIVKKRVPVYSLRNGQLANWGRDWQYELPSFFGVMSTVDDLAKWDTALRNGSLLKRTTLDEMWTPATLRNGNEARVSGQPYGLGWTLGDNRGHRVAAHEGASGTLIVHFINDDLTVIVFTNLGNPSPNNVGVMARGIAGLIRPELLPAPMMQPAPDPHPDVTARLLAAVTALAKGETTDTFMPGGDAALTGLPERAKTGIVDRLRAIDALTFLGSDNGQNGTRRGNQLISETVYYRNTNPTGTMYLTFWLTSDQRVADFQFFSE
jgi:CubicO group peptidase (beta-lactamase class C family)